MSRRLSRFPYEPWLLLALVLLLASALRFYRIDAQSFWNDEGNSARLAERSVDLIIKGAKGDIHPPGYYLAIHYWRALFGQSEAALRGLSALCSVALVGFTFLLSHRLFQDVSVGLLAAALVALNPFEVYYAQEARMYAMLAMWALASTWAMVTWWQESHRHRFLAAYILTAVAGLYTHYAFPFVMLAQSLSIGAWLWATRREGAPLSRALAWVLAQGAIFLLYLPWLPTAWGQVTSWSPPREAYKLTEALADIWRLLNFGQTIPTAVVTGGMIAAGSLVFLSLLPPVEEGDRPLEGLPYLLHWGLLAALVLLPVGLILGLELYRAAYQKFLLVTAAPLALLVARGWVAGWRVAGGSGVWGERGTVAGYRAILLLLAAFFLFDTGRSLYNLYFDPDYARADYRAIAHHIQANARPGDAVILNAPNQWEVFTYYYPDDENVFPLARQRPLNVAQNRAELERIIAAHQRVYAIFWGDAESDPERFIEGWLESHTYKAGETWYRDVRLAVYAVPAQLADAPAVPLDARFGSVIHLDGYALLNDQLAPGDILQLALFWRAAGPIPERYKVFVHLYDGTGVLVTQTDSEPGATLRPTDTWVPGEQVPDRYGVLIPPEAPAGTYALAVGLYPLATPDDRLPVMLDGVPVGDRLNLASVIVTRGVPSTGKE